MKSLVGVLAALALTLNGSVRAGVADLVGTAPSLNTDGSTLTDLTSIRIVWGCAQTGTYPFQALLPLDVEGSQFSYHVIGLPDFGKCYFSSTALNALNAESAFSNEAIQDLGPAPPPQLPPTPTQPPTITATVTPVVAVSVSFTFDTSDPDIPLLSITGSQQVTIALDSPLNFDWIRLNPTDIGNGTGGTIVPTIPALGSGNNDGTFAQSVVVQGPINSARADIDTTPGANGPFTGATITVGGVQKRLTQSGAVWSIAFP